MYTILNNLFQFKEFLLYLSDSNAFFKLLLRNSRMVSCWTTRDKTNWIVLKPRSCMKDHASVDQSLILVSYYFIIWLSWIRHVNSMKPAKKECFSLNLAILLLHANFWQLCYYWCENLFSQQGQPYCQSWVPSTAINIQTSGNVTALTHKMVIVSFPFLILNKLWNLQIQSVLFQVYGYILGDFKMKISDTLKKDPKMKTTLIINSCAIQVHNENHHKVCGLTVWPFFIFR